MRTWLAIGITCSLVAWVLAPVTTSAQVTTSITPSGLGTRVVPKPSGEGIVHEITGGTRAETNLFHGFGRFNLAAGEIANFLNDSGLATKNIFGRVVDGQPSLIFGTLRTTDFPGANLYLMNPAGVIFGSTARIDLGAITGQTARQGGSFAVTTADYLKFSDGAQFHANPAAQNTSLSAAPVTAFGFLRPDPAAISIQGTRIEVAETQSLTIIAGNRAFTTESGETAQPGVTIIGGTLSAPSGRIHLASVDSTGEAAIGAEGQAPVLETTSFSRLGAVELSGGTQITVSTLTDADGIPVSNLGNGSVLIRGNHLSLDNASIESFNFGSEAGHPTAIRVEVTDEVSLANGSLIRAGTIDAPGGDVLIKSVALSLAGGSLIGTESFGAAAGGNLSLITSNSFTLSESSTIQTVAGSGGDGGRIDISAQSGSLDGGSLIQAAAGEIGNGGIISLRLGQNLSLTGGSTIATAGGGQGAAGTIAISAGGTVTVSGQLEGVGKSQISTHGGIEASAKPGDINITAKSFIHEQGADLESLATDSVGANVTITATELVSLTSGSRIALGTAIQTGGVLDISAPVISLEGVRVQTRTVGAGDAGTINLHGTRVTVKDSQVNSDSQGRGRGGDATLLATDRITLDGAFTDELGNVQPGGILAQALQSGNAGNLSLTAPTIDVTNGARISNSAQRTGNAGSIDIAASNLQLTTGGQILSNTHIVSGRIPTGNAGSVTVKGLASPAQSVMIDGAGSGIFTETQGTGAGGAIRVETNTLTMQNGGTLSAATSGTATSAVGGDITLSVPQSLTMTNQALITTTSSGPANAGSIMMEDPRPANVTLTNSSIIAQATAAGTQASGGNITLLATDTIRLTNSQINTSVQGGPATVGGTISIDPQFVILQNSQIVATAVQGQGGIIQITAGTFLKDPSSSVSASSQLGINGTVDIRATVQNLSGALVPLPEDLLAGTALVAQRCAARLAEGQISSFVLAGREGLPAEPSGSLSSPLEPRSAGVSGSVASPSPSPLPLRGGEGVTGGEGGVRGAPVLLAAGTGFGSRLGDKPIHAEDFWEACRR